MEAAQIRVRCALRPSVMCVGVLLLLAKDIAAEWFSVVMVVSSPEKLTAS
jgi:hypothetical protein